MSQLTEVETLEIVRRQLADLFDQPVSSVTMIVEPRLENGQVADGLIRVDGFTFLVEIKQRSDAGAVAGAIRQLAAVAPNSERPVLPLVVVPFMGDAGRRLCEEAGVAWLDLSGNAAITAPGLRLRSQGRPNRYKRQGRPANPFAPRSARITRHLLLKPQAWATQRELARATGLDEGMVSKVVRRLESDDLLERDERNAVRPRNPELLLDAWHDSYRFTTQRILKGHIAARAPEDLLLRVTDVCHEQRIRCAATGLAAAWLYTRFATYRVTTLYLDQPLSDDVVSGIGFRPGEEGSNLWLVLPNDNDVYTGGAVVDGVPCVSPLQVYLDLKYQPERASEAAAQLRREMLQWDRHAT